MSGEKQAELIFNPQGGLKPLDSRVILTAAGGNPRYQNSGITVFTFKTTARRFRVLYQTEILIKKVGLQSG